MDLEGELISFIKVWTLVFVSLLYCYSVGKMIQQGFTRLFFLLPIICLFLVLPLNLSSVHLGGMTAFSIAWLANFKLLLYAFGQGPLSSDSSISLIQFLFLACFPIKIHHNPSDLNGQNAENPSQNGQDCAMPKKWHESLPNFALLKGILLLSLIHVYDYKELIHPRAVLVLFGVHIYIFLELILAILAVLARALIGFELEPPFNEPYLSTSLQDFWGKRWNIMVTSILRPTVYLPLIKMFSPTVGRRWASLPAIMGTFVVSAIMHELIFYYLGRTKPTWEITSFFLLHGVCLMVEVALKKVVNRRWKLPVWLSAPLTIGFVLVTCFWLFFPPFLFQCKADLKAFDEYAAVGAFLKKMAGKIVGLNVLPI